jgi:hypothetical protein
MPDSGSQIATSHCVGRANEVSRCSSGDFFGGEKNSIGNWALEWAKGRPVNVVNNYRHRRTPGSEATENAGLAAVGMDNLRGLFAQQ